MPVYGCSLDMTTASYALLSILPAFTMAATIQHARQHWGAFNTWQNHSLVQHRDVLLQAYQQVRQSTISLTDGLSAEDMNLQSMPETSPAKWHLAHTTWFFETFLLNRYLQDYQEMHPDYARLFNSYYNGIGEQYPRPRRSLLSRPDIDQVLEYRRYVDKHMLTWLSGIDEDRFPEMAKLVILGLNHEQQHQELLLTDIQHSFSFNPLSPAIAEPLSKQQHPGELQWVDFPGGITSLGLTAEQHQRGFAFDNETPRHQHLLHPWQLANRPVVNGEFLEFIQAGGYQQAEHWHSDGWSWVQQQSISAPLYWSSEGSAWHRHTLAGSVELDEYAPLSHISWYEACAYASWRGCRLPTEAEWEHASLACNPETGQFADDLHWQPAMTQSAGEPFSSLFGSVWEWTASSYSAYPGFCPPPGALGEYNGKFMANQYVLRGGSCVTPAGHIRASYRNFFYPQDRWQFSGIRLARDCQTG